MLQNISERLKFCDYMHLANCARKSSKPTRKWQNFQYLSDFMEETTKNNRKYRRNTEIYRQLVQYSLFIWRQKGSHCSTMSISINRFQRASQNNSSYRINKLRQAIALSWYPSSDFVQINLLALFIWKRKENQGIACNSLQNGGHEPWSFQGKNSKLTPFDNVSVHRFRWSLMLLIVRHIGKKLLKLRTKKERNIKDEIPNRSWSCAEVRKSESILAPNGILKCSFFPRMTASSQSEREWNKRCPNTDNNVVSYCFLFLSIVLSLPFPESTFCEKDCVTRPLSSAQEAREFVSLDFN